MTERLRGKGHLPVDFRVLCEGGEMKKEKKQILSVNGNLQDMINHYLMDMIMQILRAVNQR